MDFKVWLVSPVWTPVGLSVLIYRGFAMTLKRSFYTPRRKDTNEGVTLFLDKRMKFDFAPD